MFSDVSALREVFREEIWDFKEEREERWEALSWITAERSVWSFRFRAVEVEREVFKVLRRGEGGDCWGGVRGGGREV